MAKYAGDNADEAFIIGWDDDGELNSVLTDTDGALRITSKSGENLNVDIAEVSVVGGVPIDDSTPISVSVDAQALSPIVVSGTVIIDDTTPVDVNIASQTANINVDLAEQSLGQVTTKEIRSSTAATTTPSVALTDTVVLAANANRTGALISNPTGGETVYLNFGAAATVAHHELAAGEKLDVGTYTGVINGISGTSPQSLAVTEFTA